MFHKCIESGKILLIIGSIFAIASFAEGAYECYQCSSCSDPFTNTTTYFNCTTGSDTCIKALVSYPGGSYVSRGCIPSGSCVSKSFMFAGYGYNLACCSGNLCNSGHKTELSYILPSMTVLVALFSLQK